MEQMIAQAQEAAKLPTTADLADWANTAKNVISIVAGIAKNPIGFAIGSAVVVALGFLVWTLIKRWIKNKEIEAAKRETERQIPDQLEVREPENRAGNDKDNDNWNKLDDIH